MTQCPRSALMGPRCELQEAHEGEHSAKDVPSGGPTSPSRNC
jgi:hypothetical protein